MPCCIAAAFAIAAVAAMAAAVTVVASVRFTLAQLRDRLEEAAARVGMVSLGGLGCWLTAWLDEHTHVCTPAYIWGE